METTIEAFCHRLHPPHPIRVIKDPEKDPDPAAGVLQAEGYIRGYEEVKSERGLPELEISLKYFDGTPVIRELRRVSTPGRRVYSGVKEMPQVRQGLGVAIVSTPKGVMSDAQARSANVGGEVLCTVF